MLTRAELVKLWGAGFVDACYQEAERIWGLSNPPMINVVAIAVSKLLKR